MRIQDRIFQRIDKNPSSPDIISSEQLADWLKTAILEISNLLPIEKIKQYAKYENYTYQSVGRGISVEITYDWLLSKYGNYILSYDGIKKETNGTIVSTYTYPVGKYIESNFNGYIALESNISELAKYLDRNSIYRVNLTQPIVVTLNNVKYMFPVVSSTTAIEQLKNKAFALVWKYPISTAITDIEIQNFPPELLEAVILFISYQYRIAELKHTLTKIYQLEFWSPIPPVLYLDDIEVDDIATDVDINVGNITADAINAITISLSSFDSFPTLPTMVLPILGEAEDKPTYDIGDPPDFSAVANTSINVESFTEDPELTLARKYAGGANSASFSGVEDIEMVTGELNILQTRVEVWKSKVQVAIEQARLGDSFMQSKLAAFKGKIEAYLAKIQIKKAEIDLWITNRNAQIQEYQSRIQAEVQKFSGKLEGFKAELQKVFKKVELQLQVSLANQQAQMQALLKEHESKLQAAITNQNISLQSQLQEKQLTLQKDIHNSQMQLQALTATYRNRIDTYSADVQRYGVEMQDRIQKFQSDLGRWQGYYQLVQQHSVMLKQEYNEQLQKHLGVSKNGL